MNYRFDGTGYPGDPWTLAARAKTTKTIVQSLKNKPRKK